MRHSTLRPWSAALAAIAIAAAASVAGVAPAGAAPGDAAAAGLRANLAVTVGATPAVTVTGVLGQVNAPPSDSADLVNASITTGAPLVASVGAAVIHTEATNAAGGSGALSEVTGASVVVPALSGVLSGPLVTSADVIRAAAECPVGGAPAAGVDPLTSLIVAGQAVSADASGNVVVNIGGPVSFGTVTLNLKSITTSTATAAAVAVQLQFAVDVIGVASVTGTVTIAEASCETPNAVAGAPTATSINPNQGPTTGGTPVTITGTGFVPGLTTVTIGGNTVPATVLNPTTLTFATPAHAAGAVDVTVTTPDGTSGPLTYTYVPPVGNAPTATGIAPDQGPTAGGTSVTITGTGFVPAQTTVTIGGNTVTAIVINPTTLIFTTPAHTAGLVDVVVSTPGGTTSPPLPFTYVGQGTPPILPPPGATTSTTVPGSTVPGSTVPGANNPGTSTPGTDNGAGPNEPGSQGPDDGAANPGSGNGPDGGQSGPSAGSPSGSYGGGSQGSLARTGSDTNNLFLLGLVTMILGAGLVAARRRLQAGSNR